MYETEMALGDGSKYIREVFGFSGWKDILNTLREMEANDVPGIDVFFLNVSNGIQAWQQLPATLDQLREAVRSDLISLVKISFWYYFAAISDWAMDFLFLRSLSAWVIERQAIFLTAFVGCVAVSIGGWVGAFAVQQAWWHGVTKPRVVVIEDKSPPTPRPAAAPVRGQRPTEQILRVKVENSGIPITSSSSQGRVSQVMLVCHWSNGRTKALSAPKDGRITIGSDPMDDIQTKPGASSKTQAMIKLGKASYFIQVLDTSFPTRLNEQIISGARRICANDTIQIGDLTVIFITPG